MGEDAEYYIEQQKAEYQFIRECQEAELDRYKRYLHCWVDGYEQDIYWYWEPRSRVLAVFSNLFNDRNIGSEYFLASCLPDQEYGEEEFDHDYSTPTKKQDESEIITIDGLEYCIVKSERLATSELIVLSHKDSSLLKAEITRQKESVNNLKEQIITEMLEEMISFIELNPEYDKFVFAREI